MKSIEAEVPYNKIAINNRKIEEYLKLNKQTVILDGSKSAKHLTNITQGSVNLGPNYPRGLDIEQAETAL